MYAACNAVGPLLLEPRSSDQIWLVTNLIFRARTAPRTPLSRDSLRKGVGWGR